MGNKYNVRYNGNKAYKYFYDKTSFEKEYKVYEIMSKYNFLPKLLKKGNNLLVLEKINAPTITAFIQKEGYIPSFFAKSLRDIELKFAEEGIFNLADICKMSEHVFVDAKSKSSETNGIRIIDFDAVDIYPKENKNYEETKKSNIDYINSKYSFLTGNQKAWEDFSQNLRFEGIDSAKIEEFKRSMDNW